MVNPKNNPSKVVQDVADVLACTSVIDAPSWNYSDAIRGERHLHAWLEDNNFAFDVAADLDLARDSSFLDGYDILIINGHSEYWSTSMWEGVNKFLQKKRKVIALTGNTGCWRVSFNKDFSIIECRKHATCANTGANGYDAFGETWHSHDVRRGGYLREFDQQDWKYSNWKLLGLEYSGMVEMLPSKFLTYTVHASSEADDFFNKPEKVDTQNLSPPKAFRRPVGHEMDARICNIWPKPNWENRAPDGAVLPGRDAPSGGTMKILAEAKNTTGSIYDYYMTEDRTPVAPPEVISEIVYWERPNDEGKVFYVGSIGFGWSLPANPELQKLLRNVLFAFGA